MGTSPASYHPVKVSLLPNWGGRLNWLMDPVDTTLVTATSPGRSGMGVVMREDQIPAKLAKTTQQGESKCYLLLLGREWEIRSLICLANTSG